jgi:hypothetical protein
VLKSEPKREKEFSNRKDAEVQSFVNKRLADNGELFSIEIERIYLVRLIT